MNNKGPLRLLAEQTMLYGLGTIVPRFLNYAILTPFYTRVLKLSEYGMVTELYAYMAVLLVLLTYGMETAFFRYASNHKQKERVFNSAITMIGITSVAFFVLVMIMINPISELMGYSAHKNYILFFSAIVAMDAFTAVPFAKLRLENKGFKFGMIKLLNVTVIIVTVFFFLYLIPEVIRTHPGTWVEKVYNRDIGVGYVFIANLLGSAVSLVLLIGEFKGYKPAIDKKLMKAMLAYALPLLIAGLFGILNESFDKIVFKRVVNVKENGLALLGEYSANYKIAVLMTLFIQMFRYAVEPFFFNAAKKENPQILYAKVMRYFVLFALFIFLGIIINLKLIAAVLIGKSFRGGIGVVPIVLAANLLYGIFINLSVWYKINDKTWYASLINGAGAIVTIIINITLIPLFGYYASAWGHLAAYLVMVLLSYFIGRRIYYIPYDTGRILIYMVATGVFFLVIYHFRSIGNILYLATFNTLLFLAGFFVFKFEKKRYD